MSNYVTLRDSNRGGCSQVCRFSFDCGEEDEYAFSSKDLNMIDYLPDMMKIGIESYKIEGRMKSLYYIATVANAYRTIMDKVIDNTLTQDDMDYYKKVLNRVSNRENTPQFYGEEIDYKAQYYSGRQEISNQDFLAIVKSYNKKNKSIVIEQRNKFSVGDEVEIFGPNTKVKSFKIDYILNENNEYMESCPHAQETVTINCPFEVSKGDIIRVKIA
jgi:putative protease